MFTDVQDFEFTIQNGRLYLLQTRDAKRTPWAALKIACDLVEEGLIQPKQALHRLSAINLAKVVRSHLAGSHNMPVARATVAGIGVVSGRIALDDQAAKQFADKGDPAILVRRETTTADILGMANAAGILTSRGGRTSHAAPRMPLSSPGNWARSAWSVVLRLALIRTDASATSRSANSQKAIG
jgi:pyruvate,orthophosphate dikinase